MKLSSAACALVCAACPFSALAQDAQQQPKAPGLTFLYSMNATLAPAIDNGAGPFADRRIIPIIGGTFAGPKLSGTIANLGADWGRTDKNGIFHPDTRYQLTTHDGAGIYIQTEGSVQTDKKIHLRVKFETGHADYFWLNYVVGVGILTSPGSGYVLIDAWQLESP